MSLRERSPLRGSGRQHFYYMTSTFRYRTLTFFIALLMFSFTSVRAWKSVATRLGQKRLPGVIAVPSPVTPLFDSTQRTFFAKSPKSSHRRNEGYSRGPDRRMNNDPLAKLNFRKSIKIDANVSTSVADIPISDVSRKVFEEKGFSQLTPVQSQSYEHVWEGADVVARSRTGTGKTFAFGLPIIEKIVSKGLNQRRSSSAGLPVVLILEPTRELANQVSQELSSLCKPHKLRILPVFGGDSFAKQEQAFRDGVHIVVATPGRLLDHINEGTLDLSHVEHVVLDEGDTMLEMGFQKDVESILLNVKSPGEKARELAAAALSADRDRRSPTLNSRFDLDEELNSASKEVQLLLYSATMPSWICTLTDKLMRDPIFLDAVQDGETRLASTITHFALPVNIKGKINSLGGLVEDVIFTKGKGGQTIVFTNTKEDADLLVNSDCFGRLKAQVLHGDISQASRQTTLRQFKDGGIDVLVATDVAARGLDIAGVDLVIHTAPPNDEDSYVHRSGRTGRAGREGTSVLFYSAYDAHRLRYFEKALNFRFEPMIAPTMHDLLLSSVDFAKQSMERVDDDVVNHFLPHARTLLGEALKGVEDMDGMKSVAEKLVAQSIAAISNRQSIPSRSMLTGEEGFKTLTIVVDPPYTPQSFPMWQRFASNMFEKKFDLQFVKFGKLKLGEEDGHSVMVVDLEKSVADDILERMQNVKLPKEVQIKECLELPRFFEERSNFGERDFGKRESNRFRSSSGDSENQSFGGRGREPRARGGRHSREW